MTMLPAAERAVPVWRAWLENIGAGFRRLARKPRCSTPFNPFAWQVWAIAAGSLLVVVLLGMSFLDVSAAQGARRLPHAIVATFNFITDYGKSGWFLWPLGVLFLVLAALPPLLPRMGQLVVAALMVRVGFLFVAIGLPGLSVAIVKNMIGRARPFVTGAVPDSFAFGPFTWRPAYASFPSGHSTTALGVLIAFGLLFPRLRPWLVIYALAVLVSRVVVTAHYPTDVLGGAIFGGLGVLLVQRYFALRRIGFAIGPDGMARPMPGPSLRRIKAVARRLLA